MTWESLICIIQGTANPEEQQAFQKWLNADHQNRALYQFLQEQHGQVNKPIPESEVDLEWNKLKFRLGEESDIKPVESSTRSLYRRFLPYAAVFLIMLLSAGLVLFSKMKTDAYAPAETMVSFSAGKGRKEIHLPDSSVVWLGRNTTLQYAQESFNAQERKVYLKGEAFFQVKRNEEKPFKVKTSQLEVKVLGTSFNVFARQEQQAEVSVATGSVAVHIHKTDQKLRPGQKLIYEASSHQTKLQTISIEEASSLKRAVLHFEHNNLQQIADHLERWYQLKVILKNKRPAPLAFTGHIPDTGIQHVLEGLTFATGLSYTLHPDNTIVIE